jgi:hypothetical protein
VSNSLLFIVIMFISMKYCCDVQSVAAKAVRLLVCQRPVAGKAVRLLVCN